MSKVWDQALEEEAEKAWDAFCASNETSVQRGIARAVVEGMNLGLKWRNGELEKVKAKLRDVHACRFTGPCITCLENKLDALSILEGLKDGK